jgi:transposase
VSHWSDSGDNGGPTLLGGKDVDEIKELKREGLSIQAISRLTGYDRKTISRLLLAPAG